MPNTLQTLLSLINRRPEDFQADANQMRDRPVTLEEWQLVADWVDGKRAPVSADDVTDAEVEAAWRAIGWEPADLPNVGRKNMRRIIAHVKNKERGHG
jgi:hypothetical protein